MRTALALLCVVGAHAADLYVGAAKRIITPDLSAAPAYLAGFGQNRVAEGVHDDLYTRCMAFRAGARPLVICGVDSIGLFFDDVQKIRARVDADVVVAATHNHETPDTMGQWGPGFGKSGINEAYNQLIVEMTVDAAREALASARPARIRLAKLRHPDLDTFIHDTRPPVCLDSELLALAAEGKDGKPIGTLVNWANHPEALDSKNRQITADYLAYFHPVLEGKLGGTSVFINGAVGGMQSPLGAKVMDPQTNAPAVQGTFRFAELIGTRTGELAADALTNAKPVNITGIVFREKLIRVPMQNKLFHAASKAGIFRGRKAPNEDGSTSTPVGYVRFESGRTPVLEIALIPGEMYPELSVGGIERYQGADFGDAPLEPPVKQQMKAPFRMLFGLANDEIGYIIPKAEWDEAAPWLNGSAKRWYGEINSVGPEAAPAIAAAFAELIAR